MSVHFLNNDLSKWDDDSANTLLLTFFNDERPLRGATGLADWRLCGRLSRLIRHQRISGKRGETLMLPPGRRLPFQRILLFGLGSSDKFNEDVFRQHVRWIHDVVKRAGIKSYATQVPGRATAHIGARRALELWLEETDKSDHKADVAIIDTHTGQKEMAEILRYRGKRKKTKSETKAG